MFRLKSMDHAFSAWDAMDFQINEGCLGAVVKTNFRTKFLGQIGEVEREM